MRETATLPARLPRVLLAAALALALALALAPATVPAHGEEPAPAAATTRVAVVQGTLPIGDEASHEASLQSSGYTSRARAQALADAAAESAPADAPLPCATPSVDPSLEGLHPGSANALSLDGGDGGRIRAEYQVGDARMFAACDRPGEEFEARVVATGGTYTIWEEEGYDLFASGELEAFAGELDAAIGKMYATFGDAARCDVDGDGKVAFVFHRFGEDMGYAAGYFWSGDLFSKGDLEQVEPEFAESTNEMDMLHLDTVNKVDGTFGKDAVMPTLVHELQHLVTFAQTGGRDDAWLNEAFSQAAEAVTGYGAVESANLNYLRALLHFGVGTSFVFEGSYVPEGSRNVETAAVYAHWYLFSRYLANQTKGLASGDGALRGGDGLYKSVFDCARNDQGFGSCTKDALAETLEKIGYLGEGAGCAAEDFDELVLNYNTALLVRDKESPYSLTNDPGADPSVIDGARIDLLSVASGFVPEAVYGGGAAVYVELDRAQPTADAGEGVLERIVDSLLPLGYAIEASPAEGSALRDGEPVSLGSPYLAVLAGARLECCSLTEEELLALEVSDYPFQEYAGPFAFDADKPVVAARIVCDRGRSAPATFSYEVNALEPAGPEEPEASGSLDALPSAGTGGDGPDAAALAPTGDALALPAAVLAALAVAGVASALTARRRADDAGRG